MSVVAIQSLADFNFNFPVKDDHGFVVHTHVVPGKNKAPKNVLVLDRTRYEADLKDNVQFMELVKNSTFRILDDVPTSYYDATQQVSQANLARQLAEEESQQKSAIIEAKDAEIAELQRKLKQLGGAV